VEQAEIRASLNGKKAQGKGAAGEEAFVKSQEQV
jgi:hypothetical protein